MDPFSLAGISWGAVQAVLAALGLFGGSAYWIIWRLHKRLRHLEEGGDERNTALFGSNENPLHVGLARETAIVKEQVESLEEESQTAEAERRDHELRISRLEKLEDVYSHRKED